MGVWTWVRRISWVAISLVTPVGYMNLPHERFDIPEETHRWLSEEVGQLIDCTLE